jgi:nucleoside 2-deoxyribosyltransferase
MIIFMRLKEKDTQASFKKLSSRKNINNNIPMHYGHGMRKQVFISGPILGMEKQQNYRKTITNVCTKVGFAVIDPWKRERVLYNGTEECWWDKVPVFDFIQRDLDDADRCDIMIVYLPILSAGACMEMFYAKRKNKRVIVVSEINCLSPWIVFHSDKIVKSFNELEETLKTLL